LLVSLSMDQFGELITELKKHTSLLSRIAVVLEEAAREPRSASETQIEKLAPLELDGLSALDADIAATD